MEYFLKQVVDTACKDYPNLENVIFIVPSIRSSVYLRKYFSQNITQPIVSPTILSIEEFITELSQLKPLSKPQLLFSLFDIYQKSNLKKKDDFHAFSKWAYTLLADFDEVDRYLIDPTDLFDYLTAIKRLKEWGVNNNPTQLISDYLKFIGSLSMLYKEFQTKLFLEKESYQGMRYKYALEYLEDYLGAHLDATHIFVGFNALNKAETTIIQTILEKSKADIFWDLDVYFLQDTVHEAGYYLRQHLKHWTYLKKYPPKGLSQNYLTKKRIQITGIPKNTSQAKHVGDILRQIYLDENQKSPVALILSDESLLPAIINSIPQVVPSFNITMGYPLTQTLSASFFELLYTFYTSKTESGWYYSNVIKLLTHPYARKLIDVNGEANAQKIISIIREKNLSMITGHDLITILPKTNKTMPMLFQEGKVSTESFIETCQTFIIQLKNILVNENTTFELEALHSFFKLFETLADYSKNNLFLAQLDAINHLFNELIALETLSFKGDPFEGLQIMGMLESRTLDFETIIITSVNEGILPAGKTHNSFIPYDVKKEFGMPTFKDKDAVYTYHFYRLLQRAQNIYITYNTEVDALEGGEKSRFISQLMTDDTIPHNIIHKIATPEIPIKATLGKQIEKSPLLLTHLKEKAQRGFSPTSLSNYIKNPYEFYKKNILNIEDSQQVEETMAYNTFGTIIHDSLELLYTPLVGHMVTPKMFKDLRPSIEPIVREQFARTYSNTDIAKGQNLIAYKVILKYIDKLLAFEEQQATNHELKIIGLEQKLTMQLSVPGLDFPITIKGKLDRVEQLDGQLRILDYKTGSVQPSDVNLNNIEEAIKNDKKAKAFQLLCYALMYHDTFKISKIEAGILPIKNISSGALFFKSKEANNPTLIDGDMLVRFQNALNILILELFNPAIPFIEKKV